MKIQKHIKVELLRKKAARPIEAVQYDTGNQIIFEITDFELPSGTSATVYFQKPSGKFVYQEDGVSIAGSTILVDLHNQALTEHGKIYYQVRIKNGADLITTFTGLMLVDKSLADAGATESKTVLAAFAELTAEKIAEIQASAAQETAEMIAELQSVAANERKAIEDTGAATLASIPAEYTDTAAKANTAYYDRARALEAEASGNPVQIYPDEGSLLRPVLHLEPIQPGSGDPYPAGGGKNLLPKVVSRTQEKNGITFTSYGDGSYRVHGTCTANGTSLSFSTESTAVIPEGAYWHLLNDGTCTNAAFAPKFTDGTTDSLAFSVGNRIYAVSGGNIGKTIKEIGVYVVNGETLDITFKPMMCIDNAPSDYAPYSNIRPISGHTGVELVRCGKNLFAVTPQTLNGVTLTVDDGAIVLNGTATANTYLRTDIGYTITEQAAFSVQELPPEGVSIYLRDANASAQALISYNSATSYTFEREIRYTDIVVISGTVLTNVTLRPQLELGSTATEYEPYQGETYPVSFGQTVYGGTVDVNDGATTETWKLVTLTGDEDFTYHEVEGTGHIFRYYMYHTPVDTLYESNLICDRYAPATFHGRKEKSAYISIAGHVDFVDSNYDAETWAAYVKEQYTAGTPIQICYKVASPKKIQLDPVEIPALAGVNTVCSDSNGGMVVGYNKSLNRAFEEALARIAALESAAVNNV